MRAKMMMQPIVFVIVFVRAMFLLEPKKTMRANMGVQPKLTLRAIKVLQPIGGMRASEEMQPIASLRATVYMQPKESLCHPTSPCNPKTGGDMCGVGKW